MQRLATAVALGFILGWAAAHALFLHWWTLVPWGVAALALGYRANRAGAVTAGAVYGFVLLMAAIAYYILQCAIIAKHGRDSLLAAAIGPDWKGKLSPLLYLAAIPLSFVHPWIANGLYVFVALLWLVPDRRIERALEQHNE